MKIYKHRGFTLVEVLIVLIVIGMLSTVMILSSTEAVTAAKTSKVINNLMNLKMAVTAWYFNNSDRLVSEVVSSDVQYKIKTNGKTQSFKEFVRDHSSEIEAYLSKETAPTLKSKSSNSNEVGDYALIDVDYKKWYVCYHVASDSSFKADLSSKAETFGLFGLKKISDHPLKTYYSKEDFVCLLIITLE